MTKIVSTVANRTDLCKALVDALEVETLDCFSDVFPAGEHSVNLTNDCTKDFEAETVVVLMEFSEGVSIDATIMRTFFYCAELYKRGAKVLLVAPFFPYGRQDRPIKNSIDSGYTAPCLLEHIGKLFSSVIHGLVTVAPHSENFATFFPGVAVHAISLAEVLLPAVRKASQKRTWERTSIVAADKGALPAAQRLAKILGAQCACIEKDRKGIGKSVVLSVEGPVRHMGCIIIDDMVDSGTTLTSAANALWVRSASYVHAVAVHPVFLLSAQSKAVQRGLRLSRLDLLCLGTTINGSCDQFLRQESVDTYGIINRFLATTMRECLSAL